MNGSVNYLDHSIFTNLPTVHSASHRPDSRGFLGWLPAPCAAHVPETGGTGRDGTAQEMTEGTGPAGAVSWGNTLLAFGVRLAVGHGNQILK